MHVCSYKGCFISLSDGHLYYVQKWVVMYVCMYVLMYICMYVLIHQPGLVT